MKFAVSWLAILLALPPVARAVTTSDSELACSLPEPAGDPVSPPDLGIDLGGILSRAVGDFGAYSAAVEPTVQLELDFGNRIVNLTPAPPGRALVFQDSKDGYQATDYLQLAALAGNPGGRQRVVDPHAVFRGAPAPFLRLRAKPKGHVRHFFPGPQ